MTALALSTFKALNPLNWASKIKKLKQHYGRSDELSADEKEIAALAKQSYLSPQDRKHVGDYEYNQDKSGHNYAVYHNNKQKKNYLVFKGTSDLADAVPDLSILFGYQSRNAGFTDANDVYQQLSKEYKDHEWQTVGHSLGGSKAMYVAEQNKIKSHAFNPGYNNYLDDELNPSYGGHHIYVRKGDPISNTILTEKLANSKILNAHSYSALQNHTIQNF